MLAGKKILIAVSGSIAAYKVAFLVRLLTARNAQVKVIMTESAKDFITPLTLATLSEGPVYSSLFNNDTGEWHNHVKLGLWADLMLIAPASANTIAKMTNGVCDNLLLATYLSAKCPVFFAPAMDLDMLAHASTQQNIATLIARGNYLIDSESGLLASGLVGPGRMAEPENLVEILENHFKKGAFHGKKILITSGPTHEAIDAVRFISNSSSGKMGKAIALAFAKQGAEVIFVSGPTSNYPGHSQISLIKVKTADEMFAVCKQRYPEVDYAIFAAAVADYKPQCMSAQKLKKNGAPLHIKLTENPDIAFELGKLKSNKQFHVGFALESNDAEHFAKEKLNKKKFDLIVVNCLEDAGAGFGHETNKITIYDRANKKTSFELKSKDKVAIDLLYLITTHE
jgi:phosphopantothenoylcysteine decarboxylase / phosphopantothenate---cysteine ligase